VGARGTFGHRLALGLSAVDATREHMSREPCLVLPAAIGTVGPDIGSGVVRVHDMAQFPPVTMGGRGHLPLADEAEASVDADVTLVAEHGCCDLRQRRAVRPVTDLA